MMTESGKRLRHRPFRPRSERTELANAWDHADDLRPEELGAFHIQPPALLRG